VRDAETASFHMPGHKGGRGAPGLGLELFGPELYLLDISEMAGLDYLHSPSSALLAAQEAAAAVFGADHTFFLVNGATVGNLAAILAHAGEGAGAVIARNSHRSVYAGLVFSGAHPIYLPPIANRALDSLFGIDLADLARALEDDRTVAFVHVTSPSYYGFTLPLEAIAAITSTAGVPLIVDEAHGSHFVFSDLFPASALECGADVVVQSPHKTLGSLTQSSLLHVRGGRVDIERVGQVLQMMQSSSPSALLLASLELAIDEMAREGPGRWERAVGFAHVARAAIGSIPGVGVHGEEVVGTPGIAGYDPCKLVVDVGELGVSGLGAATWLRSVWGVNPEFSDLRRLVFSITTGDDESSVATLIDALSGLATANMPRRGGGEPLVARWPVEPPEIALSPRAGFALPAQPLALDDALGKVAAEMVVPYPPGIPLLVPGETVSEAVLATIVQLLEEGVHLVGMSDPSGRTLRCGVGVVRAETGACGKGWPGCTGTKISKSAGR
jgi:arginine decarboxylase